MTKTKQFKFFRLMKVCLAFILLAFMTHAEACAQTGSVKGKIKDAATGEGLIGASVLIQGTTKGTVTDYEGNFILNNAPDVAFNLVISYVAYEQQIVRMDISKGAISGLEVKLKPVSVELNEVRVIANRRKDTELSLISSMRSGNLVANGISRQQITRSQDKDASEVVARVPGVTVRDGKFINVRGLDERYNVVWLNGTAAPSSEADRRAFSFDMIPSALIDNLVLYKTPAPELPADFAGAVILIQTKNTVEDNSTDISYSTGYRQNTTFRDFYTYQGGKTDWLGWDDGTRALPDEFPSTSEFREMADNSTEEDQQKITALGKSFSKTWSPEHTKAIPDQSLSITMNRKFLFGKVSVGNITSLGYSTGEQFREVFRAGYQAYDITNDSPDTAYYFNDDIYSTKTRLNGLFNWHFVFGNNQKIEFRNFFNQYSDKQTILRSGRDNYGGINKSATELSFQSRSIYSGQLAGHFNYNQSLIDLDWTLGYSYTNKLQPDIRRVEKNMDDETGIYKLSFNFNADPKMIGRLHLTNNEIIYFGTLNYSHRIPIGSFIPEIKTGVLIEHKYRDFTARNIGFAPSNVLNFNWDLMNQPIDSVFRDQNINYTNGIKIDESTNPTDSYNASNLLYTGYVGINIPVGKLKIYTGLRVEKNIQRLEGLKENKQPYRVNNDFTDFFPSLNMAYTLSDKSLLRFAYGRTINRPEFREISLQTYYDFEEKATIYGDTALANSYIQNLDLRYEYFTANGDLISLGGFYKHFDNPIEAHLKEAGSGRNYTFDNAETALSYGVEVDLRKSFRNLENYDGLLRAFRHIVVVFNAAFIRSELHSNDPNARDEVRQMQGQSPYILNTGLFYDNPDKKIMISAMYNIIGPRLMFVGDVDEPHIIQMPRNLIDITLNKKLGSHFMLRMGVKDLFNQPVELRQNERIQLIPGVSDSVAKRVQRTQVYKPSSSYMIGISYSF